MLYLCTMITVTHHKDNAISFRSPSYEEIEAINKYYNYRYFIEYIPRYSKYTLKIK